MEVFRYALVGAVCALVLTPPGAGAEPLRLVTESANSFNCLFFQSCTGPAPVETVSSFMLPGGDQARLHTSTIVGTSGSKAADLTAYAYRVDLTSAKGNGGSECVTKMTLDFGPDVRLPMGPPGDVYYFDAFDIVAGGPGTIGMSKVTREGSFITFSFDKPICPSPRIVSYNAPGQSSFLFGLAAKTNPPLTERVGNTQPRQPVAYLEFIQGGNAGATAHVPPHISWKPIRRPPIVHSPPIQ